MIQMSAVFAEFERAITSERIKSSIASRRAAGKPVGRPPISDDLPERIRKMRRDGKGIQEIRQRLRCGTGTVRKVVAELHAPS